MEGVMGVGFALGPIVGNYIDNAVGFSNTYFIVGAALAPSALLVLCLRLPYQQAETS